MKFVLSENDFAYQKCDESCINDICRLQDTAFKYIDNNEILRKNSREMLLSCLKEPHYTLGAYHDGELAAFAILYFPGNTDESIARDMGIPEDQLSLAANFKLVIVSPEYRGNGLQRILATKLERIAKERGIVTLCATVSPLNIHSERNFQRSGYTCFGAKTKYDGLRRMIYYKNI